MAELWHYTSEGRPMDPVTGEELRQLAACGRLRPTDLVWQEGMPRWVRASSTKGLFPEQGLAEASYAERDNPDRFSVASENEEDLNQQSRPRRRGQDRDDDDDFDDRPRRRRSTGIGTAGKVGILIGAVFFGIIVVGVALYFVVSGDKGPGDYSVGLDAGRSDTRYFVFKAGVTYRITVNSERDSDVDILILDGNNQVVAGDVSFGPNSQVAWRPATTASYRVEIQNLGPGWNRSQVKFAEQAGVPVFHQRLNAPVMRPPAFQPPPNRPARPPVNPPGNRRR